MDLIIEPCQGWRCGDGLYPVLRDAQKAALESILGENLPEGKRGDIAGLLLGRRDDVLEVLSLEAPKERKRRADYGSKRTRKIAPVAAKHPATNNEPPVLEAEVTGSGKYRGK